MLGSFYIRNFRLFKELSIEQLGQINLIVGKNNSGKSCLLEALYLYANNASPYILYELIKKRGEDWEVPRQSNSELQKYYQNKQLFMEDKLSSCTGDRHPFRHFFYGYRFPKTSTDSIELGESHRRIRIHLSSYQVVETDEQRILTRVDLNDYDDSENVELILELEENNKFTKLANLSKGFRRYPGTFLQRKEKFSVKFVHTSNFREQEASVLWDNINIHPDLRQEVFNGLKLIDKKIQEVVKIGGSHDATFLLIYEDIEERLPLDSMGEGMTRLFHIILGLVNAKNGILLIDEVENGLHYEVHAFVWDMIFKLAKQLNIQIFATTHSGDCVRAFQEISKKHEDQIKGMLFHLGKSILKSDAGKIIATVYDEERLALAAQAELEVR